MLSNQGFTKMKIRFHNILVKLLFKYLYLYI